VTALERVRRLCLALPEAHEVEAWGEPTFRARNKIRLGRGTDWKELGELLTDGDRLAAPRRLAALV
jgi:hypothetical protein